MLKKVLTGTGIAVVLATVFLLGSLLVGTVSAHQPQGNTDATQIAAQSVGEEVDMDDVYEQVGEQSELDDDVDEAKNGQEADIDDVQEEVEEEGGVED